METDPPLVWDDRGLIPAVAQDRSTGAVLMVAWMNREALDATRETGEAHFYSRSRARLWKKGESSGNVLVVRELRVDCDGDTLLLLVDPAGPACHTGRTSCFYRPLAPDAARDPSHQQAADDGPPAPPAVILERVARVIESRRASTAERSYVRSLLDGGPAKVGGKITEEAAELVAELPSGTRERIVSEAADLLFHTLVGLAAREVPVGAVFSELARRFGTSGHDEKQARTREPTPPAP